MVNCNHKQTHYEDWSDGGTIEVCDTCGMSRHHWEQGQSNWIMVDDISKSRKELQESIDSIKE